MPFAPEQAEKSVVRVLDLTGRGVGLGVFLDPTLILTASHSLPRERGNIVLPSPDASAADMVPVVLGELRAKSRVITVVTCVEPCSDVALLSDRTYRGSTLPDAGMQKFVAFSALHVPAKLRPLPVGGRKGKPFSAHLLLQDGAWVGAEVDGALLALSSGSATPPPGTSGAIAFDDAGKLVGLVTYGGITLGVGNLAVLTTVLPAWALSRARKPAKAPAKKSAAAKKGDGVSASTSGDASAPQGTSSGRKRAGARAGAKASRPAAGGERDEASALTGAEGPAGGPLDDAAVTTTGTAGAAEPSSPAAPEQAPGTRTTKVDAADGDDSPAADPAAKKAERAAS